MIKQLDRRGILTLDEVEAVLGPVGVWQGKGPGIQPDWEPAAK
jgi:hypothetical protein